MVRTKRADVQIYHATCRAEQMNARKNAKLLNPNGRLSGSPRITPQLGESEVKAEPKASPVTVEAAQGAAASAEEQANVPAKRKADGEEESNDEVKRVKVEPAEEGAATVSQAIPGTGEEASVASATAPVQAESKADEAMPAPLESSSQQPTETLGANAQTVTPARTASADNVAVVDAVDPEDEALYGTGAD